MAELGQGSWGQGSASPRPEVKWSFLRRHLDLVTEVQEGLLSCTPRPASLCPQSPASFLLLFLSPWPVASFPFRELACFRLTFSLELGSGP